MGTTAAEAANINQPKINTDEIPENAGGMLLVWVTNPMAAGRIVAAARRFAENSLMELKVVSVQSETRDNWEGTIRDLEQLEAAARNSDAELTVVYSDDKIGAAVRLVSDEQPQAMFVGIPDKSRTNMFTELLQMSFPAIPLYCVDNEGQVNRCGRSGK